MYLGDTLSTVCGEAKQHVHGVMSLFLKHLNTVHIYHPYKN